MAEQSQGDIGILVLLAYQGFVRELHEDMARRGFDDLGRSDGVVMRMVARQPLTVSELAARLEVTKQGAAQIVSDMERRGYVRRTPDPDDARARRVALTERGGAVIESARRFHRAYERRLARAHGADDVAVLRRVLETMAGTSGGGLERDLRGLYL